MAFFAARQPILDTEKRVFGYELLFRTSTQNVFPDVDQEKATSKMIEGLYLDLGLDRIASGKWAFINFTENSILKSYPALLPKNQIVVEVLEDVRPTKAVYTELKKLAIEGFTIALDDFVHSSEWEPFYKICQIIKVDCQLISEQELAQIEALVKRHPHIRLLAEKVETYDEYNRYKDLGFELFQGYFFSKPEVIKSVSLTSSQSIVSSLLGEVTKADPNFNQITKMFELDVALSFKLLRYTQSPLFQRRRKIENIKQAVVMLGQKELERFIVLLFAATFSEGKPSELIRLSLTRAKFCELLADKANFKEQISSAFLVGMLSLIDAMLDTNIKDLIGKMPLSDDIKSALLAQQGWLADFIKLCQDFEKGNWSKMETECKRFKMDYQEILENYQQANLWAEQRLAVLT